jgi:Fe2+ transport system protein FeoA
MNQYGSANLITQQKLLEMGTVKDGAVEIAGRHY